MQEPSVPACLASGAGQGHAEVSTGFPGGPPHPWRRGPLVSRAGEGPGAARTLEGAPAALSWPPSPPALPRRPDPVLWVQTRLGVWRAGRFPEWRRRIGHTRCLEPRTGKVHTAEGAASF